MEDNDLVAGCLQGKTEDFRKIVDKYSASALAVAINILGNRDDAEDVCQEAFIQVYRNIKKFDVAKSFKNWFYTIVYRRSLDALKKRRRSYELAKKMHRETAEHQKAETDLPASERGLPSRLLAFLNPRERMALCLWANEGYSAQEISEVLRCSAGTARVYLFHARKKIKAFLEKDNVSL